MSDFHDDGHAEIPQAVTRKSWRKLGRRFQTRLWWLVGLCLAITVATVAWSWNQQGTQITIRFSEGHGIKPGDAVQHRGIDVGSVIDARLASDAESIQVTARLFPGSERLAVEGSEFWIERPQVRLGQVSGIDTVVGAKYIQVIPGSDPNATQRRFDGRDSPLTLANADAVEISVEFPNGEGLQIGDPLRHRGISIGEVTAVRLSEANEAVEVQARLVGNAKQYARRGTQFWIERPRLELTEVRGLETLFGTRYVAVQPMERETAEQLVFQGLPDPPPIALERNSLQIELDAPSRLGLVRGAPVTYRGLEIGQVNRIRLARDSASIKIAAVIDGEHADLVRTNSRWWAYSGISVDAKLTGFGVNIDSLDSLLRGGVAFATPDDPGDSVAAGHRFMLEATPREEWLEWEPRIAINRLGGVDQTLELPQSQRVVASWKASLWGLYRRQTEQTWGLLVEGGRLYVPTEFVRKARQGERNVRLELAGKSIDFPTVETQVSQEVSMLEIPADLIQSPWPAEQISSSRDSQPTMLIINDELNEPLAIDATRVAFVDGLGLRLAPGVAIPPTLTGSPVVNADSGAVYGLLIETDQGWGIGQVHLDES